MNWKDYLLIGILILLGLWTLPGCSKRQVIEEGDWVPISQDKDFKMETEPCSCSKHKK